MDTVFAGAAALVEGHADGGAEEFRLSLEDVQFIDPYGLVGLWCVFRYLQRRHPAVAVIPPTDRELQGYLRRMDSRMPSSTSRVVSNPSTCLIFANETVISRMSPPKVRSLYSTTFQASA